MKELKVNDKLYKVDYTHEIKECEVINIFEYDNKTYVSYAEIDNGYVDSFVVDSIKDGCASGANKGYIHNLYLTLDDAIKKAKEFHIDNIKADINLLRCDILDFGEIYNISNLLYMVSDLKKAVDDIKNLKVEQGNFQYNKVF